MNERIKLLAEQATTYIEPTANSGEGWIFDKEKFAELLVRECAALAKSKSEYIESMLTDDRGDKRQIQSLAWQFEEFGYQIKKHFGVEE
jgi:alpha-D-ribose 1-methylphosphonate 5-phosphate C-P lyase